MKQGIRFLLTTLAATQAFLVDHLPSSSSSGAPSNTRLYNTGGWGIGPQRDLTDAEFLRGDRGAFSGYELQPDFGRKIEAESKALRSQELDELLGVAASAGIDLNRVRGLDRFSDDGSTLEDDGDDLDVSVDWDVDIDDDTTFDPKATASIDGYESITRLDEDTGALGTW